MVSAIMDDAFGKYYDTFMPQLKNLLNNISPEDEAKANIRLITLETITFVISSIRHQDNFISEIEGLMEQFIQTLNNKEDHDPENGAIIDFFCQMSANLNENFEKYIPFIFDKILSILNSKVKVLSDATSSVEDRDVLNNKKFAI